MNFHKPQRVSKPIIDGRNFWGHIVGREPSENIFVGFGQHLPELVVMVHGICIVSVFAATHFSDAMLCDVLRGGLRQIIC